MKPETVFALENASWPALLVDATGGIRAASQGARDTFGQVIATGAILGQSIWSKENEQTAEESFASYDGIRDGGYLLRFKGKERSTATYQTHSCPTQVKGDDLFLLQMFKPMAIEEAPALPVSAALSATEIVRRSESGTVMEASLAHEQKLDCAM